MDDWQAVEVVEFCEDAPSFLNYCIPISEIDESSGVGIYWKSQSWVTRLPVERTYKSTYKTFFVGVRCALDKQETILFSRSDLSRPVKR